MRRIGLLLLAGIMIAGVAGCSKGADNNYDFNGTWTISAVVTQSTTPLVPVGQRSSDVKTIAQDGTSFVLIADDGSRITGTCDPKAGTFEATNASPAGSTLVMTGHAVDDRTLTAEVTVALADFTVHLVYTFDLISR
jgi:hypothetical protein